MNYISFSNERLFIIITIYPIVPNVLFDTNTLWIVIIINLTNKAFIFSKSIYLGIIYEYVDIFYIIIDFIKVFITIAITSTVVFKPFITV